jgi:NAD(P)-dependent dehydrogenase (short-subunit alcohol dehydrogenase family)
MGALAGKVAVITGGSSGIGLATVRRFLAEGANVVISDLQPPPADVADSPAVRFVAADVGDPAAWSAIVAEAEDAFGGLNIAYLNAGITTGEEDITAVTDDQYHRIMRANVDGVVFGARAVVPAMEKRGGGAVVATASLAGIIAFPPDPLYTLTKHAVVGLVRSLAPQLSARGITINAVCPGITRTPLVGEEATANLDAAGFPLMPPEQIADAVLACVVGTETGQAYACQPGREPVAYRFGNVPGPRTEGAEGALPPTIAP